VNGRAHSTVRRSVEQADDRRKLATVQYSGSARLAHSKREQLKVSADCGEIGSGFTGPLDPLRYTINTACPHDSAAGQVASNQLVAALLSTSSPLPWSRAGIESPSRSIPEKGLFHARMRGATLVVDRIQDGFDVGPKEGRRKRQPRSEGRAFPPSAALHLARSPPARHHSNPPFAS
jgi:hypothetical protein